MTCHRSTVGMGQSQPGRSARPPTKEIGLDEKRLRQRGELTVIRMLDAQ